MLQVVKDELNFRRKLMVLGFARVSGSVKKTCREFGVPSSSFYEWKKISIKAVKKLLSEKSRLHTVTLNNFHRKLLIKSL